MEYTHFHSLYFIECGVFNLLNILEDEKLPAISMRNKRIASTKDESLYYESDKDVSRPYPKYVIFKAAKEKREYSRE